MNSWNLIIILEQCFSILVVLWITWGVVINPDTQATSRLIASESLGAAERSSDISDFFFRVTGVVPSYSKVESHCSTQFLRSHCKFSTFSKIGCVKLLCLSDFGVEELDYVFTHCANLKTVLSRSSLCLFYFSCL